MSTETFLIFLQSTKNEISWRRSVFLGGDIASVCFLWHLSLLYIQYSSRWPRSTHRSQKPTCVCYGGHYHNTGNIYLLWKPLSSIIIYYKKIYIVRKVQYIFLFMQVLLQLLFITDAQRRRIHSSSHDSTKPGRQVVTFLLICNFTMWIIYTFEVQKVEDSPIQVSLKIVVQ